MGAEPVEDLLDTTGHDAGDVSRAMENADYRGSVAYHVKDPVGLDGTAANLDASEPFQFALDRS